MQQESSADMKGSNEAVPASAAIEDRILGAAFEAFAGEGYAATSTLDIARRAKVSKRDLYANFGSKQAVLVACIKSRAARMRRLPDLPPPRNREMLAATITAFAANLVREISDPSVIAAFRLAIAEASRAPEIAQALDGAGRAGARQALASLFASAQSTGLLDPEDASEMATQYFGLLWEGLLVGLLLGVEPAPGPAAAELRARKATAAFMRLHPGP
jgi:AcrR family transcriptional regulator